MVDQERSTRRIAIEFRLLRRKETPPNEIETVVSAIPDLDESFRTPSISRGRIAPSLIVSNSYELIYEKERLVSKSSYQEYRAKLNLLMGYRKGVRIDARFARRS